MKELKIIENGLIKVYQTDSGEYVVDGRELWHGLGSKQDFSTWVKRRLNECDAAENQDYSTLHKKVERQMLIEYIIKLDTAKEMAMLERNEIGKQYRRYFIELEKKYKNGEVISHDTVIKKYYKGNPVATIKDISMQNGEKYNVIASRVKRICIENQDYCVISGRELAEFKKENDIQQNLPSLTILYPSAIEKIGGLAYMEQETLEGLEYLKKNLTLQGMIRLKYYESVGTRCGMDMSFMQEIRDSDFREEIMKSFRHFGYEYFLNRKPEELLRIRDLVLQELIRKDEGIEIVWLIGKYFDSLYATSKSLTSVF